MADDGFVTDPIRGEIVCASWLKSADGQQGLARPRRDRTAVTVPCSCRPPACSRTARVGFFVRQISRARQTALFLNADATLSLRDKSRHASGRALQELHRERYPKGRGAYDDRARNEGPRLRRHASPLARDPGMRRQSFALSECSLACSARLNNVSIKSDIDELLSSLDRVSSPVPPAHAEIMGLYSSPKMTFASERI